MAKLHPGDAWGGGSVCPTWAPAPMPDQVGDESLVWVDAHGLPKLIPSLVTAPPLKGGSSGAISSSVSGGYSNY